MKKRFIFFATILLFFLLQSCGKTNYETTEPLDRTCPPIDDFAEPNYDSAQDDDSYVDIQTDTCPPIDDFAEPDYDSAQDDDLPVDSDSIGKSDTCPPIDDFNEPDYDSFQDADLPVDSKIDDDSIDSDFIDFDNDTENSDEDSNVVFQSGFENWHSTWPEKWNGVKSNMSEVTKYTEFPHSGKNACLLDSSKGRRFSTMTISISSAGDYLLSYFVKGHGKTGVQLYYANSFHSVFLNKEINSNKWIEIVEKISLKATNLNIVFYTTDTFSDKEHLQIDDVKLEKVETVPDNYKIGWCKLISPSSIVGYYDFPTEDVYTQIFVDGLTNKTPNFDFSSKIKVQVGFSNDKTKPFYNWFWFALKGNQSFSNSLNDEYKGTMIPNESGDFAYITRVSGDGGTTWKYCDFEGNDSVDLNKIGTMSVLEGEMNLLNGDFSLWRDDSTPISWNKVEDSVIFLKKERIAPPFQSKPFFEVNKDFALEIKAYSSGNRTIFQSSSFELTTDKKAKSLSFDIKSKNVGTSSEPKYSKMVIYLQCDNYISINYNKSVNNFVVNSSSSNNYVSLDFGDENWHSMNVSLSQSDLDKIGWAKDKKCKVIFRAGNAVPFDVLIDNVKINY